MKQKVIMTIFCWGVTFYPVILWGQAVLNNASFEDKPNDATTPQGWIECNPGTTPDILPGFWGVTTLPQNGNAYIGLITRKDGSSEAIGQQVFPSLSKDHCYHFELFLAKSKKYVGYTQNIQLRVYLGSDRCEREQLVFTSPPIKHRDWKKYEISFTADSDHSYLIIEVYADKLGKTGHVLIDNISPIHSCSKA